ncbi:hypothetical protein [Tamlana sp. I1]|nr:hypothetical protein [Tamlana sp. I1]
MKKEKIETNVVDNTEETYKTPIPSKNKWLHTTDSFGKLEKGVVED